MENNDSEDFFSIGMGFVTPGVETGVAKSDTISKKEESPTKIVCNSIKENCDKADVSIKEDKDKSDTVKEIIEKDSDSALEEEDNSTESYFDEERNKRIFSLENAMESVLVTENINSASEKELKTIGNILILTKKLVSYYKQREAISSDTNNPSTIILQNLIKNKSGISVDFSYLKYKNESLEKIFRDLLIFIKDFSNSGNIGDIISSLQNIGSDTINVFDVIKPGFGAKIYAGDTSITSDLDILTNYMRSSVNGANYIIDQLFGLRKVYGITPVDQIVDSTELIDTLIATRNSVIDICLTDDFEVAIENIRDITKFNDISISFEDKLIVEKITNFVYEYSKIISTAIQCFCSDTSAIFDSTIDNFDIKEGE